jgi:Arc/MetJ-type ribon-helix-helix transcriptional regulator
MPKGLARTTFRLPAPLLEDVDEAVRAGYAPSRSAFVSAALRRELAARKRQAIDVAFAEMADDDTYRTEAAALTDRFLASDWEALRQAEHQAADAIDAAR